MSRYKVLSESLQKIKRSEERLTTLIESKSSLEMKVKEKKIALDKENYDVEKLEGISLEGFFHLIKGTLIDKLDKEEKEAMIAKNQYDNACNELNYCLQEIMLCQKRIQDKYVLEREYEAIIEAHEQQLLSMNSLEAKQVNKIIEQVYYKKEVIRELEEAVDAGHVLLNCFMKINECLNSFEDTSQIKIMKNGLITSEEYHEAVNCVNEQVIMIQPSIQKYHLEVLDVVGVCDIKLSIDGLLDFSDDFITLIIKHHEEASLLPQVMKLIDHMIRQIDKAQACLNAKKEVVASEIDALKENKVKLIEIYLETIGGINEKSS